MSYLALFLLGQPRIECEGEQIKVPLRKATALLFYLAVMQVSNGCHIDRSNGRYSAP